MRLFWPVLSLREVSQPSSATSRPGIISPTQYSQAGAGAEQGGIRQAQHLSPGCDQNTSTDPSIPFPASVTMACRGSAFSAVDQHRLVVMRLVREDGKPASRSPRRISADWAASTGRSCAVPVFFRQAAFEIAANKKSGRRSSSRKKYSMAIRLRAASGNPASIHHSACCGDGPVLSGSTTTKPESNPAR